MRQLTAIQVSVPRSHPDVNTGIAGIGTGCDDPGVSDALVFLLKAVDQPVVAAVTEGLLVTMGAIALLCDWRVGMDTGRWVSRLAQALANDRSHHGSPVATAARDDRGLNAFLRHCFTHYGQSFAALIHADWSLFPLSSTKRNHE